MSTSNSLVPDRIASRAWLIILVVLGHNKILHDNLYYTVYVPIYSFHVSSFFLLVMLSNSRSFDFKSTFGLIKANYYPFLVFCIIYSLAYYLIVLRHTDIGIADWVGDLARAVTIANMPALKSATGFKLFWFIPSFIIFCIAYNFYGSVSRKFQLVVTFIFLICHLTVGLISHEWSSLIPWGATISLYLLIIGLAFRAMDRAGWSKYGLQWGLAFLISIIIGYLSKYRIILSDFEIYSLRSPLALIVTDVQMLSGAMVVLNIARISRNVAIINYIGQRSLQIYLTHGLINVGLFKIFRDFYPWQGGLILITIITFIITISLIRLIEVFGIQAYIFGPTARPHPPILDGSNSLDRSR